MNKLFAKLYGTIFLLAVSASAMAGDFKGIYIGGNIGGVGGTSDAITSTVFSPTGYFATSSPPAINSTGTQLLNPSGFTGGGGAGFNLQFGHLVLGAEFDFNSMQLSDSKSATGTYPCCAPTGYTVTQSMKTDWLFTARPRAGIAFHRVLLYGTGGAAVTNVNYQSNFTDTFATAAESGGVKQTQTGWIAGGGAEVRLSHHFSIKGEYLHADFGANSTTSTNLTAYTPAIAFPTNTFTHISDLTANIGRFGFNYRF